MLTHDNIQQISHVAQLAVLAMCARGFSAGEFESSPEILEIRFSVKRPSGVVEELPVDVEFVGSHSIPVGGMSL